MLARLQQAYAQSRMHDCVHNQCTNMPSSARTGTSPVVTGKLCAFVASHLAVINLCLHRSWHKELC